MTSDDRNQDKIDFFLQKHDDLCGEEIENPCNLIRDKSMNFLSGGLEYSTEKQFDIRDIQSTSSTDLRSNHDSKFNKETNPKFQASLKACVTIISLFVKKIKEVCKAFVNYIDSKVDCNVFFDYIKENFVVKNKKGPKIISQKKLKSFFIDHPRDGIDLKRFRRLMVVICQVFFDIEIFEIFVKHKSRVKSAVYKHLLANRTKLEELCKTDCSITENNEYGKKFLKDKVLMSFRDEEKKKSHSISLENLKS